MTLPKRTMRALVISAIILLFLSTAFMGYHLSKLSKKLDQERLEKESLLSEKIHLSRSLDEMVKDLNSARERNNELNRALETTLKKTNNKLKNH